MPMGGPEARAIVMTLHFFCPVLMNALVLDFRRLIWIHPMTETHSISLEMVEGPGPLLALRITWVLVVRQIIREDLIGVRCMRGR